MTYQVWGDGKTVWVDLTEGNIARFSKFGIDIHRSPEDQSKWGQCLHCSSTKPTNVDWEFFKGKMKELYGIEVPNDVKPNFLNT